MRLPLLAVLVACSDEPTDPGQEPSQPTGTPPTTTPGLPPATLRALADAAEVDLAENLASGVSIAVWHEGRLIYAEGFGTRHPDSDEPVTPDTVFQIGSDTKKITALAALQAVERGELALDATVAEMIPGFDLAGSPGWADDATLHHLLSHQGGMYDYTPWDVDPDDSSLEARAFDTLATGGWAMSPPGAFWNYANPNFSLAGLAIERATGRAWADVVTDDLFAPLGLEQTFARKSDVVGDDVAVGYGYTFEDHTPFDPWDDDFTYTFGTVEHADETDNAFIRPAGLVWSTAGDMAALAAFLVDGDPAVLSDDLREAVVTGQVALYPRLPELGSYGYGVLVFDGATLGDEYHPMRLWQHGGNTLTMTSALYVLPDERFAIAILSNGYGDYFDDLAVTALLELAPLPDPATPEPLAPADLASFAGTWTDPVGVGSMTVTHSDPDLLVELPGFDAIGVGYSPKLTPYADGLALATVATVPYELTWIDGPAGAGQWVRNRQFVGEQGEIPAAARRRIGAPPVLLEGPKPAMGARTFAEAAARR